MIGGFALRDTAVIVGAMLCILALVVIMGALLWAGVQYVWHWINGD